MKRSRILPGLILVSTFFGCSLNLNTEEHLPEDRNEKLKCSSLDSFPCSSGAIPDSLAASYQILLGLKDLSADSVSSKAFMSTLYFTNILRIGNNISSLCPLPSEVMLRTRHYKVEGFSIYSDSLKIESLDGDLIFSTWNKSTSCSDGCSSYEELHHTICNPEPTVRIEHFSMGNNYGNHDSIKLTVGDWQVSCKGNAQNSNDCFFLNKKLVLCDTLNVGHCARTTKTELDSVLASMKEWSWNTPLQPSDSQFLYSFNPIFKKLLANDSLSGFSFYCELPDTLWQTKMVIYDGYAFDYKDLNGNIHLKGNANYLGSYKLECYVDSLWGLSRYLGTVSIVGPMPSLLLDSTGVQAWYTSPNTPGILKYNW